jgi:hypothetical protein
MARERRQRLAAIGMSMISMIGTEAAMKVVDRSLTGGAMLTWRMIPPMLAAGFAASWPYDYRRLKKWARPATNGVSGRKTC